ncbi:hypothetical protein MXF31_14760 [Mammaliicoccus sciuri]|uniref:hypothetical protein n=1 Tax=Mammaliicoccus sciuri TaxID=1296 RepID=UPI002DBB4EB9|nr:hypothetical protein [Mammaliicoccus sciuri]MEB5650891.1 hypothetical protein [Mammaliicoccus sciuri]
MKIVYLYDGTPFIVELNNEGEYVYPNDEYTEVPPPEGIYQPFYYDGNEWIGTSKEKWESNQSKPPIELNVNDFLNAQLISNDMEHNEKLEFLQQDIANLTSELLIIKGGMNNVSNT